MWSKVSTFIDDSKRIITVSRKPGWQEFKVMSMVTGIGIIIIGVIAFIVQMFFQLTGIGF